MSRVKYIVAKGDIAYHEQIPLMPQCFPNSSNARRKGLHNVGDFFFTMTINANKDFVFVKRGCFYKATNMSILACQILKLNVEKMKIQLSDR